MKKIFRLVNEDVRKLACTYILSSPDGYIVTIAEPTRNLDQNAKLWALLTEVSAQVNWHGNHLTPEEWKFVFGAALKKQKVVPGIDGGFVVCGQSTSNMSKSEFSEMIELITAFAAQQDVRLSA